MMTRWLPLFTALVGCVAVTTGAALIAAPAGWIVAGVFLVSGSYTWQYLRKQAEAVKKADDELERRRRAAA